MASSKGKSDKPGVPVDRERQAELRMPAPVGHHHLAYRGEIHKKAHRTRRSRLLIGRAGENGVLFAAS